MSELTQERLKELLSYDPETGLFSNLTRRGVRAPKGGVAGTKNHKGYIAILIDKKIYLAHRLAWLYVYGEFPEKTIDHINEIKDDNRIINLRSVTNSENQQNISILKITNTSGFRGVSWNKKIKKWAATISINGKSSHLGSFNTAEEASEVYLKAKRKFHTFWVEGKI